MTNETTTVILSRIVRDRSYQVRGRLSLPHIHDLMRTYKAGKEITPITVAVVHGKPVLIDGWHRVEAMQKLGWETAEAIVIELPEQEARWRAAEANMNHGLKLKPSELRQVFRVYVKTKRHVLKERLKSYREIASEIGVVHGTIRNWMMRDFPKVASRMGGFEEFKGKGGFRESEGKPIREAKEALGSLMQTFGAADGDTREELVELMEKTLRDMREGDSWRAPQVADYGPPDF